MIILDRIFKILAQPKLDKRNQEEFDNATTCMCGKPAVAKVRCRYNTPYKPTWGQCEEHLGMPLDHPWIDTGNGMKPMDPSRVSRLNLDGSPASPEYPILVEYIQ